jgi:hypothetical protein
VTVPLPRATSAAPTLPKSAPSATAPTPSLVDDIRARLLAAAASHEDPVDREKFLQSAVHGVPRALFARLVESLSSAPAASVEMEILRAILVRWAWDEPTNVAAWAIDHPGNPSRQDALALAAQRWAAVNPGQLLTWSASLSAADRQWVLLRSGDYLGRTDPSLFAVWQQALQPGRERDQLELALAREWSQRDPAGVLADLATNSGPEFAEWRRLTLAGLADHLTTMDGPAAADFVTKNLMPGAAQETAAMGAVVAWARQDPAAAQQWIESFSSAEFRSRANQVVMSYWLERDPVSAQAYANSLPAGGPRDEASEHVAQFLAARGPRDAISWAERISDPRRKSQALDFVLSAWERQDPDAMRDWQRQQPPASKPLGPNG